MRSELAALDGQLKRLATAFQDDLRRQFYWPVLKDMRRRSNAGRLRMGQIQTTTIRTNDRTVARVSPGPVAVLERPVRPVLAQEGLQVAHGLVQEAQTVAQYGSMQAAGNALAPGGGALLAQVGVSPVPGQHLGQLVAQSEQVTVSVGDDIQVTPVIQSDGCSVAFHLVYTHTPRRDDDARTPVASGVQRHMVEADVHLASLELQEVSRPRPSRLGRAGRVDGLGTPDASPPSARQPRGPRNRPANRAPPRPIRLRVRSYGRPEASIGKKKLSEVRCELTESLEQLPREPSGSWIEREIQTAEGQAERDVETLSAAIFLPSIFLPNHKRTDVAATYGNPSKLAGDGRVLSQLAGNPIVALWRLLKRDQSYTASTKERTREQ